MTINKSATEELEEFKAAALMSVWRERLLDIDKKTKRIEELEEENKNLRDDCEKIRQQRNQYRKELEETEETLEAAKKGFT